MVALNIGRYERPVVYAGTVALATSAYYLAGRIGLELAYLDGAVAAMWPPAGVGLAVLFLFGLRLWPAIVIGDLLLGDYSTPLGTVLAQTVGNTVALVVAAWLLRRFTRGRGGRERGQRHQQREHEHTLGQLRAPEPVQARPREDQRRDDQHAGRVAERPRPHDPPELVGLDHVAQAQRERPDRRADHRGDQCARDERQHV